MTGIEPTTIITGGVDLKEYLAERMDQLEKRLVLQINGMNTSMERAQLEHDKRVLDIERRLQKVEVFQIGFKSQLALIVALVPVVSHIIAVVFKFI